MTYNVFGGTLSLTRSINQWESERSKLWEFSQWWLILRQQCCGYREHFPTKV